MDLGGPALVTEATRYLNHVGLTPQQVKTELSGSSSSKKIGPFFFVCVRPKHLDASRRGQYTEGSYLYVSYHKDRFDSKKRQIFSWL